METPSGKSSHAHHHTKAPKSPGYGQNPRTLRQGCDRCYADGYRDQGVSRIELIIMDIEPIIFSLKPLGLGHQLWDLRPIFLYPSLRCGLKF